MDTNNDDNRMINMYHILRSEHFLWSYKKTIYFGEKKNLSKSFFYYCDYKSTLINRNIWKFLKNCSDQERGMQLQFQPEIISNPTLLKDKTCTSWSLKKFWHALKILLVTSPKLSISGRFPSLTYNKMIFWNKCTTGVQTTIMYC